MTQEKETLVVDLQTEVRRLARRAAVMNVGLDQGLPLTLVEAIVRPVLDQAALVCQILERCDIEGLGFIGVKVSDPVPDNIAEVLSALGTTIPDDLSGLTD